MGIGSFWSPRRRLQRGGFAGRCSGYGSYPAGSDGSQHSEHCGVQSSRRPAAPDGPVVFSVYGSPHGASLSGGGGSALVDGAGIGRGVGCVWGRGPGAEAFSAGGYGCVWRRRAGAGSAGRSLQRKWCGV